MLSNLGLVITLYWPQSCPSSESESGNNGTQYSQRVVCCRGVLNK
jgi:hypothetical protein